MSIQPEELKKTEFRELDYRILGHAYAIQNEYGNQLDEICYQNEIAHRIGLDGFNVRSELGITLSHEGFRRTYFADLVIDDCLILEVKAVSDLVNAHKRQLLHYLFLTGISFGRLLNFRTASVQKWMMSNAVGLHERQSPDFVFRNWEDPDGGIALSEVVQQLISDWGTGLFSSCYKSAISERLQENIVHQNVPLFDGNRSIGRKYMDCFGKSSAFILTAYSGGLETKQQNFTRLLYLTKLETIHWVNIDLHTVTLSRVTR